MLTTVAAFREPWEAHMFCSRLEAEGVPAFVIHEYHVGNAWHYSTALGGVKVQVFEERREEAKSIESHCRSGEFRSLLESEFGNLDDVHCPNCGSHEHRRRRPLLQIAIAITVMSLFGLILPPTGWVYFCDQCGTKFRQPLAPDTFGKWAIIMTVIVCDLVLLLALAFCLWALGTSYWSVMVLAALAIAGPLIGRRLSRLNNDRK